VLPDPLAPRRRPDDDRSLIARVLAGDPAAERALYDAHVDRVYRLVYRICGDDDQAQDCVQETFIRAFARLDGFRGDSALSTWIGAIAISTALNAIRKRKRVGTHEMAIDDAPAAALAGSPVREAEPDLKSRLHGAIDGLPDGYRTVFLMHDVEGYTHEEIAAALGVQPGTSKAQLFRARAKLRTALADFAAP
jgi:RNA polymerase sigma-70 factor (ECF subfamily)